MRGGGDRALRRLGRPQKLRHSDAMDGRQELVLKPRRVGMEDLQGWSMENLRPTDPVVFEATTNAWEVHRLD